MTDRTAPGRSLRPYLELIRVFLTPTAIADSYAGLHLAATLKGSGVPREKVVMVAAASVFIYWMGMAANDLFDLEKDKKIAPFRPLPSGSLSVRSATVLCAVLAGTALVLGYFLAVPFIVVALIALVILYDGGGKDFFLLGNLLMGLCRSTNLLLGAGAAIGATEALREPKILAGAAVLGLYILGVTASSRLEDFDFNPRRLRLSALPLFLIPIGLLAFRPTSWLNCLNSALLLILVTNAVYSAERARGPLHGAAVFVGKALSGIFLVDAGIVLALSPPGFDPRPVLLTVYILFALTWTWRRSWARARSH